MRRILIGMMISLFFITAAIGANYGGTLNVAIPTDVSETLDPHKATGALTFEILYNTYEALIQVDTEGKLVPSLAGDWEVGEDGKKFIFKLKEGVTFHDGSAFTAKDVQFTFERVLDPDTGYAKASNYQAIEHIETPDEYTVVFYLNKPYSPFLALVSKIYILPSDSEADFSKTAVGTGPFKLVEWKRDSYIYMKRFDDYHIEGVPYLGDAYFRVIPDENARFLSLQSGKVDAIPRIDQSFVSRIEGDKQLKYVRAPMNLVQLMALNNAREPLNDIRVRKALNYAIDRQLLIEFVAQGMAKPVSVHMTPMSPYYTDVDQYAYNPEKAQELLKKAGFNPGELKLTIALPQPYEFHQRTGEVVAQMLEQVGIKVDLQIFEWGKWISDVYRARDYDMTIIGIEGEPDPYIYLDRFYSGDNRNFINLKNPRIDTLLDELKATYEFEERRELVREILSIMVKNARSVWLMEPDEIVALRQHVQNWTIYPVYVDSLKDVWLGE